MHLEQVNEVDAIMSIEHMEKTISYTELFLEKNQIQTLNLLHLHFSYAIIDLLNQNLQTGLVSKKFNYFFSIISRKKVNFQFYLKQFLIMVSLYRNILNFLYCF